MGWISKKQLQENIDTLANTVTCDREDIWTAFLQLRKETTEAIQNLQSQISELDRTPVPPTAPEPEPDLIRGFLPRSVRKRNWESQHANPAVKPTAAGQQIAENAKLIASARKKPK